jgi:hypothetical protein
MRTAVVARTCRSPPPRSVRVTPRRPSHSHASRLRWRKASTCSTPLSGDTSGGSFSTPP